MFSAIVLLAASTTQASLSYVGSAVSTRLSAPDFASQKGKTWDQTDSAVLNPGWFRYTPVGMAGQSSETLVVAKDCNVTVDGTERCNGDFGLFRCDSKSPCQPQFPGGKVPRCTPLQSTVTQPGMQPENICIGHSYSLYEAVYSTIVQTERYLDLASLTAPDGRYLSAVRNAINILHAKKKPIDIRLTFGLGSIVPKDDVQGYIEGVLADVVRDVPKEKGASLLSVSIGIWASLPVNPLDVTWNHAKIIAVDGNLLIEGGHNLWTLDYATSSPILDLSMIVQGPTAMHGHRFIDQEWTYLCDPNGGRGYLPKRWTINFPKQADPYYCPKIPFVTEAELPKPKMPALKAAVPVFSMGRLGNIGPSSSDAGIEAMFGAAQHSIKLLLQDLGPALDQKVPFNWFAFGHSWVMISLVKAMLRGVQVSVVQSQLKAMNAYGVGWSPEDVAQMAMWYLYHGNQYGIEGSRTDEEVRRIVCTQFTVTTLHYFKSEPEWVKQARCPVQWQPPGTPEGPLTDCDAQGSKDLGAHTKFWIVDDAAFYIGSQNIYPHNLAEWGLMVDDSSNTATVLSELWNPVWEASLPYAPSGLGHDVAQCMEKITIPWFPLLANRTS